MENAYERGEALLSDVSEGLEATYLCLDDMGADYVVDPPAQRSGVTVLTYSVREPADLAGVSVEDPRYVAWLALVDDCQFRYSAYVDAMYQAQPSSVAESDRWFNSEARPTLVACLERNGVSVDPTATREEIVHAALDLMMPRDDNGVRIPDAPLGPDCLYEAGM